MPASCPTSCPRRVHIREGDWTVAPIPPDLLDRRVEITGPVDRKMIINALNSGANVLHGRLRGRQLADLGQHGRGPAQPERRGAPADRLHRSAERQATTGWPTSTAVLFVRPRGWHLPEKHVIGRRRADVGLAVRFRPLLLPQRAGRCWRAAAGPYFYLPKMESHLEARLWNDVFVHAAGRARHPARHRSRPRC